MHLGIVVHDSIAMFEKKKYILCEWSRTQVLPTSHFFAQRRNDLANDSNAVMTQKQIF